MAESKMNRTLQVLGVVRNRAGNTLSLAKPGTNLNNTFGVFGVLDHAHRMVPAVVGGLMAKSIYTWGVKTFKKGSETGFYRVANNDESAGSLAIWLVSFLLLKFIPGDTTERLCCGLVGRGSIVLFNTVARWMGKEDWVRANETTDRGMDDGIDITPKVVAERLAANQPEGRPLSDADLDRELLREVGNLAMKSPEFREKVSASLAGRVNEYLESQGRKTIDEEVVHNQIVDMFRAMSRS